jgi:hypothetical protein
VTLHRASAPRFGARWSLLAAGLGLVMLLTFVVACQSSGPAPDVGAPAVSRLASTAPGVPVPSVDLQDGSLPTADETDPPLEMKVPALKLDATVAAVGVDPKTGDFDVPPSVDRVGWYRFGPGISAEAGSIVIAGHVDSAEQGKGAFFKLGSMRPGDRITLSGASGAKQFKVVGRERYAKTKIPLDKYFARDGALRLTLITCGGPFDPATGHYRDNVVVTATPA